jgi:hypothetical protein
VVTVEVPVVVMVVEPVSDIVVVAVDDPDVVADEVRVLVTVVESVEVADADFVEEAVDVSVLD